MGSDIKLEKLVKKVFLSSLTNLWEVTSMTSAGLKTLWKHNIYGLSPNIGSAHYLLVCNALAGLGLLLCLLEKSFATVICQGAQC